MIVHFICRGNSFRSIIAEAYLNSLQLKNVRARSSGTVGAINKTANAPAHQRVLAVLEKHGLRQFAKPDYGDQLTAERLKGSDVVVCVNQIVYDEAFTIASLPRNTIIWNVSDVGEPGKVAKTLDDINQFIDQTYYEIVEKVDDLVDELLSKQR